MKKAFYLFLVLALCMSLCACGQKLQDDNNTTSEQDEPQEPRIVELTIDNWSEYLELISIYKPSVNGFGEVDSVTGYKAISLKEEYHEMIDTQNSTITVEIFFAQGTQHGAFSEDYKTFTPDGVFDKLEGHERTEVHKLSMTDYGFLACYSLSIFDFENSSFDSWPSEEEILRVSGTLVFN